MRTSFIHRGGPTVASYRYRAEIPARELGASINDLSADVLIFCKPEQVEVAEALWAKAEGKRVVVDFCDDHFDLEHYRQMLDIADDVTCPTPTMRERIEAIKDRHVWVMCDPYEFPEVDPHVSGVNLLWYGHAANLPSLMRVIRFLDDYPLMIVSNSPMAMPWSFEEMLRQFAKADIVILPTAGNYKSANRAVEAIRQGCFVVAEHNPAIEEIPGIYIGNLKEGVEWVRQNLSEANLRVRQAQSYVHARFSPRTLASAWKCLLSPERLRSTSEAAVTPGPVGSMSMDTTPAM